MYQNCTIGVVIPAFNEEGFVGAVIDSIPRFVDRVYVIDDGSTDGTWQEIRFHSARMNADSIESPPITPKGVELSPRVIPIRHRQNSGVGAAKKNGISTRSG